MPPIAVTAERFHINHVATATRTLICLVTLTFDLLTLKLVRIIARRVGNLPTNFGVYGTFRSRLLGQHLPDAPRDIAGILFLHVDPRSHLENLKISIKCHLSF